MSGKRGHLFHVLVVMGIMPGALSPAMISRQSNMTMATAYQTGVSCTGQIAKLQNELRGGRQSICRRKQPVSG